jgi:hypothetical protein
MVSGMDSLMQRLGGMIPEELKRGVEQFMVDMKAAVEKINANQLRIETALTTLQASSDRLEKMQDNTAHILAGFSLLMPPQASSTPILENGAHSGNLITSEKFPQEMVDDVMTAGIPTASDFDVAIPGGDYGRRARSHNEE